MSTEMIYLDSDYEYVLGSVMGNILNLQAEFSSMEWTKSDLELISKELVNTAKLFAAQQGLGPVSVINDVSIYGNPVQIHRKNRHRTGTLINSIHANVVGNTIDFFNNANLGRGFYAGHIEYGFHDRAGNPVAARPFMRPAFQAVARASVGKIRGTLKAFLERGLLLSTDSSGRMFAQFGTPFRSTGDLRVFYNQPRGPVRGAMSGTYTTQGLLNPSYNKQSYWWKGTEKSNYVGVNKDNRMLGTVRDRYQAGFIGRGNGRVFKNGKMTEERKPSFLTGNKRTASTWKYGNPTPKNKKKWGSVHSVTPETYDGYGRMNHKIPGRGKNIHYSPKETQRKLQERKSKTYNPPKKSTKNEISSKTNKIEQRRAARKARAAKQAEEISKYNANKKGGTSKKTQKNKKPVKISKTEKVFIVKEGEKVTKSSLLTEVWSHDIGKDGRYIDTKETSRYRSSTKKYRIVRKR